MHAKRKMKLFPLTKDEAKFLQSLLEKALSLPPDVSRSLGRRDQPTLLRIISVFRSGGWNLYAGSVTDQEGDSTWEVSSSLRGIREWAKFMSVMSYESPRTYRVSITRSGFGSGKRLNWKPRVSDWW